MLVSDPGDVKNRILCNPYVILSLCNVHVCIVKKKDANQSSDRLRAPNLIPGPIPVHPGPWTLYQEHI